MIKKIRTFITSNPYKIAVFIITSIVIAKHFYFFYTQLEIYDLVLLNSTSALCLDGSNAGYYLSRSGN